MSLLLMYVDVERMWKRRARSVVFFEDVCVLSKIRLKGKGEVMFGEVVARCRALGEGGRKKG